MVEIEMYLINKLMGVDELDKRIKCFEKDVKVLKRLYFVKNRCIGDSVEVVSRKVGITEMMGYEWQKRWNKDGYAGLIPMYAGVRCSRLKIWNSHEIFDFM